MAARQPLPELEVPRIPPAQAPAPLQVNLFTGQAEVEPVQLVLELPEPPPRPAQEEPAVTASEDASQLYVSGFGLMLGKKSERLVVKSKGRIVYQAPFFRLQHVTVGSRGVSFSSDLLEELCQRGIRLAVVSGTGRPIALVASPMLTATIEARRQQILALSDARGLEFARQVVAGKLGNQEKLLRYFAKNLKERDPERYGGIERLVDTLGAERRKARAVTGSTVEDARATLMGIEGVSGRLYWEGIKIILAPPWRAEFEGREHRGATDPVNSLLNFGYGVLYNVVWGAVLNAGLEPFAGFLHVDRPGKPSLVLDLAEEFRQPVVDRTVVAHLNLGEPVGMKDGMLDEETKRRLVERLHERLVSQEGYRGKKHQVRSIIQMQARRLAAYLRAEDDYRSFSFKW